MENGKGQMLRKPLMTAAAADSSSICHLPFTIFHTSQRRRAFTLIQLLVVIGIIVVLIGLGLPAILKAYNTGLRTRTEADLQTIAQALEHYRTDFGDYPRFDDDNTANGLNTFSDRGARLLCRALIGPGPAISNPAGAYGGDGADGPGFRVRAGTGGKTWGPYIQPDKFTLGGTDKVNYADATINDRNNKPILYYPAAPGVGITSPGGYVSVINPGTIYPSRPVYNGFDNGGVLSVKELQFILGDRNNSGFIDPGETAVTTTPYLLWTAGADGIYGRDSKGKTDDITNFDIPPDLRK
jgi:type II secretory pathway pseudopilin PulG